MKNYKAKPANAYRNFEAELNRLGYSLKGVSGNPGGRPKHKARLKALDECRQSVAVNQFLTGDAITNPRNGLQALGINLLPAVDALAECAPTNPFQGAEVPG